MTCFYHEWQNNQEISDFLRNLESGIRYKIEDAVRSVGGFQVSGAKAIADVEIQPNSHGMDSLCNELCHSILEQITSCEAIKMPPRDSEVQVEQDTTDT